MLRGTEYMLSSTILEALMTSKEMKELQHSYKQWLARYSVHNTDRGLLLCGLMDLFGKYRTQNIRQGLKALSMAAMHDEGSDSITAYIILGIIYAYGFSGIEKNVRASKIFFDLVAHYNDPVAFLHYAILHKTHGKILPTNEDFQFVSRHIAAGIRSIKADDGLDHSSPSYRQQRFSELVENAKTDKAYHILNLALAYEYGVGTPIDKDRAIELYLKAKDTGHEFGQQYADKLIAERDTAPPLTRAPQPLQQQQQKELEQKEHKRKREDASLQQEPEDVPLLKRAMEDGERKSAISAAAAPSFDPTLDGQKIREEVSADVTDALRIPKIKTQTFGISLSVEVPASVAREFCTLYSDPAERLQGVVIPDEIKQDDPYKHALSDYRSHRENGDAQYSPNRPFPEDGQYRWEKDSSKKAKKGHVWIFVRYTEGDNDHKWMRDKDDIYVARRAAEQVDRKHSAPLPTAPLVHAAASLSQHNQSKLAQKTHKREREDASLQQEPEDATLLKKPTGNSEQKSVVLAAAAAPSSTAGSILPPTSFFTKKRTQPAMGHYKGAKTSVQASASTAETSAAASIPVSASVATHTVTTHKDKEFKPEIQPDQIDYTDPARFFVAPTQKDSSEHKKIKRKYTESHAMHDITEEHNEYSDQARTDIGRWGEDVVYHLLQSHYQKKYPDYKLSEQSDGFTLTKGGSSIRVIWYNKGKEKTEDSGESKDLTVTKIKHKREKSEKHYVIEVKTTTAAGQNTAFLTKNEWQQMLQCSTQDDRKYRIFRVHNAGKTNPVVKKIKNPFEQITTGQIEVSGINLRI